MIFYSVCLVEIVCVCVLISTCLADVGYYEPYPRLVKGPIYKGSLYKSPIYKSGYYKYPFYKGPIYKGPIYKGPIYDYADDDDDDIFPYTKYGYAEKWPVEEKKNELLDYWNTFKEIFLQSYEDLKKPYIVEKPVPVAVPVPVDRVRTVVKKYPVFINTKPSLVVIKRYKHR